MSVWTTKSLDRNRDYIVLKHPLRGINYSVQGVRFRDGYGVVEKSGKVYKALKSIPVLKKAEELPLSSLLELKFITRPRDIETVYGTDVYRHYLKAAEIKKKQEIDKLKAEQEEEHVSGPSCSFRTKEGTLCQFEAIVESPSGYCKLHLLNDELVPDLLGIDIPHEFDKRERKKYRNRLIKHLAQLKKQGKF